MHIAYAFVRMDRIRMKISHTWTWVDLVFTHTFCHSLYGSFVRRAVDATGCIALTNCMGSWESLQIIVYMLHTRTECFQPNIQHWSRLYIRYDEEIPRRINKRTKMNGWRDESVGQVKPIRWESISINFEREILC